MSEVVPAPTPDAVPTGSRLARIYGLRVIDRIGPSNVMSAFGVIFWFAVLVWLPMSFRPDMLWPAELGSDGSNYAAAGERLAAGTPLYSLEAGDRPAPQDNPPDWSGPILSPPTVAVIWAPLTLLPDVVRFYGIWALGIGMSVAMGLFLLVRLSILVRIAILLPLIWFGLAAWSGNLNALIAPAMALAWLISARDRTRVGEWTVGILVGSAAVLKLGPAVLVVWLLAQRRYSAVASAGLTALAMSLVAIWLGGIGVFASYVDVVLATAGVPSTLSIPGLLAEAGFPPSVGRLALILVVILGCVAIVVTRRHPGRSFAIAVVISVVATTVVRIETLTVALAALVPWATHAGTMPWPRWRPPSTRSMVLASSAVFAALAIVVSGVTGGMRYSSMTLVNATDEALVVRFTVPVQFATFGYRLEAGSVGNAWSDQMGSVTTPIVVTTADCRLVHVFMPDAAVSSWRIGPSTVAPDQQASSQYLAYSSACAEVAQRVLDPTR